MNDLNEMLRRTAEPDDAWALDRQALLAAGRRRVVRRRVVLGSGAVVAAAVAVAGVALLPGGDDAGVLPAERPGGGYTEVRLSPDEMEARCTEVTNRLDGTTDDAVRWVAGTDETGRPVPAATTGQPVETREGHQVVVHRLDADSTGTGPAGGGDGPGGPQLGLATAATTCTIPQEHLLDELDVSTDAPLPEAGDEAAVAEACSRRVGYDVRAWRLAASAATASALQATFLSDDGYGAACELGEGYGHLTLVPPEGRQQWPAIDLLCSGESGLPSSCGAAGVVRGLPDGHRIELRLPDGASAATTTSDGAYALALTTSGDTDPAAVVVTDPEGRVVWRGRLTGTAGGGPPDGGVPPQP